MSKAFGAPGNDDTWEHADKDAIGAAFNPSNRIWFTMWRGALTEVMFPTVDSVQIRDLILVVSDGKSYVSREDKDFDSHLSRLGHNSQAYRFTAEDSHGYRYEKEVICDPDAPCVLQHYLILQRDGGAQAYFVCNPHLSDKDRGERAHVVESHGHKILIAHNGDRWAAMGVDCGFCKASVGYAGKSDGVTDLMENCRMDYEFTEASTPGNVVLTGQIPEGAHEFTLALALGDTAHAALFHLTQSLSRPFEECRRRYVEQWNSAIEGAMDLAASTADGGRLYQISRNTLYTHEDRKYSGAIIASLATPWGEVKGAATARHAGYHLVWPRDAVHCATALLATGDRDTPLRTLMYLAVSQRRDGSFGQNFWIDGAPNLTGLQLDEVCFPVLLAHKLHREEALKNFNPRPMVYAAMEYLVDRGPITPQERWEQMSGYSPSTLAIEISALICAALFAREDSKPAAADFLEGYADWLRSHLEEWTVTTNGEAVPDIRRHFIRITPAEPGEADGPGPNDAVIQLHDQAPGLPTHYPARDIVDGGFLELVRYGAYRPDDPIILDSVGVIDQVLKVETPFGPCWHRFSRDGYGQKPDGGPYKDWGVGRAWPLLTGERGVYEVRAGRDPRLYIETMERFAGMTGLLDEQVWDRPFTAHGKELFGCATGSARPLAWAHAEYLKLVRSQHDGEVYDLIQEVRDRYEHWNAQKDRIVMWSKAYQTPAVRTGKTLRVFAHRPFRLRYTLDDWAHTREVEGTRTEIRVVYADIDVPVGQKAPVRFSFFWNDKGKWERCAFAVGIR